MFNDLAELNDNYQQIYAAFDALDETDASMAFAILKDASALQASFEKKCQPILGKSLMDYERRAKALQAKISRESSTKVNEGDRISTQHPDVLDAWERVSDIQKSQRYVDATAKHLSRMYFDSKLIFENVCRATRQPVGDDKLVGRI